jgi:hypothetical protein
MECVGGKTMRKTTIIILVTSVACGMTWMILVLEQTRDVLTHPQSAAAEPTNVGADNLRSVDELLRQREDPGHLIRLPRSELSGPGVANKEALLLSDLQTVRSQVEIYRILHMEQYPGVGSDGSFDPQLFARQLTHRTNANGQVAPANADRESYPLGPHLAEFPTNPFVNGPAASKVSAGRWEVPGDGSTGWYFNTETGRLSPNDPGHKDL